MPKVPLAQPSITRQPRNLPAFSPQFQTARGATPEAFGAATGRALQQAGAQTQASADLLAQRVITRQAEDNEREAKELDVQLTKRMRELAFGENGFLTRQGSNAVDTQQAAEEALQQARNEISKQASNSKVQQMFSDIASQRMSREFGLYTKHVARQRQIANDTASKARLQEFVDDAIARRGDDEALGFAIVGARNEAQLMAQDQGLDEATQISSMEEVETLIHENVIAAYAAEGNLQTAISYFEANKDRIDGRRIPAIQKLLGSKSSAQLTLLRRETRNIIDVLEAGKVPPDNAAENMLAILEGIPGNQAQALRLDLQDAINDNAVVRDFNERTITEQEQFLLDFDRNPEATDDTLRQSKRMRKSLNAMKKAIEEGNGIEEAAARGLIDPLSELDFADPESYRQRSIQSAEATKRLGQFISPFTDAEVDDFLRQITGDPSEPGNEPSLDESMTTLQAANEGLGEETALFLAGELIDKKQGAIAMAMVVAPERETVARDIILGQRLLKSDVGRNLELPPADIRQQIDSVLGNVFMEDASLLIDPTMAAANALYAKTRIADKNDLTFDSGDHEDAINAVTGNILRHNGRNIIAPIPGMTQEQWDDAVNNIQDSDLGRIVTQTDNSPITASMLKESFFGLAGDLQFVSTGFDGQYQLFSPGSGWVVNDKGEEVVVDMKSFIRGGALIVGSTAALAAGVPEGTSELQGNLEPGSAAVSTEFRFAGPKGTEGFVIQNEGRRNTVYMDSENIPTVGIGFNLTKTGARQRIEALGVNFEDLLAGRASLTDEQVDQLFFEDLDEAEETVRNAVPRFSSLSANRQIALIDLAFNLGRTKFNNFDETLPKINSGDFDAAANLLTKTKWFKQVGARGPRVVSLIRNG